MSTTKHTKGPWHAGTPRFGLFHIYSNNTIGGEVCNSGKQAICNAPHEGEKGSAAYHEMFVANAHLIAAAPDLLEALQAVVVNWTSQFERRGHLAPDWCKQARAAIAKATGEQP